MLHLNYIHTSFCPLMTSHCTSTTASRISLKAHLLSYMVEGCEVKKLLVKLTSIDSPGKLNFILATNDMKDFVFGMSSE